MRSTRHFWVLLLESAGADSGYDISLVHQQMQERGIRFYTPSTMRSRTTNPALPGLILPTNRNGYVPMPWWEKGLPPKRLQRNEYGVYREYRAEKAIVKYVRLKMPA